MKTAQRVIKYLAVALALALIAGIFSGIMSAVSFFGAFSKGAEVTKDLKAYSVSSDIKELKIDVAAVKIYIIESDTFSVSSNIKDLEVIESGGILSISKDYNFGADFTKTLIKLYIPAGYQFEKADIKIGAGELKSETLSANSISLKIDAGRANIKKLNADQKVGIDGAAGKIVISDGTLNNLDLNIGVGKVDLTSAVLGKSNMNCGVGKVKLTLIGSETDYRIKFNMGVGSASIDGAKAEDSSVFGSGENEIKIDSDVGNVKLGFKSNRESE